MTPRPPCITTAAASAPSWVLGQDVEVDVGLGLQLGGRRDDEADRLHVAEPLLMSQ